MDQFLVIAALGLAASLGVLGLFAGHLAIWKAFWQGSSAEKAWEVSERIDGLELYVQSLADQFETTVTRNNARVGKLRRKLAEYDGSEPDEDEGPRVTAPADTQGRPGRFQTGSDVLRYAKSNGMVP